MDIQLLLDKGRKLGFEAKLRTRFEYAWRSCSGDLRQQSDLFRLSYAIETLKAQGWRNELVTLAEWNNGVSGEQEPALYVVKSALNAAFTTEGRLIAPLEFKIAGDAQIFVGALATNHITASCLGNTVTLIPLPFLDNPTYVLDRDKPYLEDRFRALAFPVCYLAKDGSKLYSASDNHLPPGCL